MLRVEDLHSYYDRSHILQGVSMQVEESQVLAILGRNGVGKTSLVRSILGLRPPHMRSGKILLNGQSIGGLPVSEVARRGIGLVPQGRRVFGSLTVAENLDVAERASKSRSEGWGLTRIEVEELFPVLAERSRQRARTLSGGEQAMLAIGRALLARPRLLIMDEPSEGLGPVIVENLVESLRSLKNRGLTILLVEQQMQVARQVADRIMIMERGVVVSAFDREEFSARWDEVRSGLGV